MLCVHGYTAHYDCPYCAGPGCARSQFECVCGRPEPGARPADLDSLEDLERAARLAGEVS